MRSIYRSSLKRLQHYHIYPIHRPLFCKTFLGSRDFLQNVGGLWPRECCVRREQHGDRRDEWMPPRPEAADTAARRDNQDRATGVFFARMRVANVVSNIRSSPASIVASTRASISRPARKFRWVSLRCKSDGSRAISSAFRYTKRCRSTVRYLFAKLVFPAPLGPATMIISCIAARR